VPMLLLMHADLLATKEVLGDAYTGCCFTGVGDGPIRWDRGRLTALCVEEALWMAKRAGATGLGSAIAQHNRISPEWSFGA
jgi:hypothetical protein